jgi:Periplasmic serine proteases (ClpP class)
LGECGDLKLESKEVDEQIKELDVKITELVQKIEAKRERRCFILWANITQPFVDKVYDELRTKYTNIDGKLDVIIDSAGGDINAAYNIASLFQKYGNSELTFFIPRWAKSAATLIACSGETILMTPVGELGPLDPQITQINPAEERIEKFSPVHISTTFEMIRNEFASGNKDFAEGLLKRLQFPLTLGSFAKAIEISEQYLTKVLKERMGKTGKLVQEPSKIARCLSREYTDHGFCINLNEARSIGLNADELDGELLDLVWDIYTNYKLREKLKRDKRSESLGKLISSLPPEVLDKLRKTAELPESTGVINDED